MGLVANVKAVAQRKKLTIKEVERRAGLPENAVYKWDRNDPGVGKVAKAAAALGVTIDELVSDVESGGRK